MVRIKSVLIFICLFFAAISITTFADARTVRVRYQHGNWAVRSDCTSVYASIRSASAMEGFKVNLSLGCENGYCRIPDIRVYLSGGPELRPRTQVTFKLADNDLSSDSWVCEKNRCSPKDNGSADKILKQLLATEGPLTVIITAMNTTAQATIDTTGINEAYQALLKRRR
ncbi:hypothetical protein LJB99_03815 [Deltaproteobacteria bacterium OttesenSCG-928-K17]|nr:hypothetical protein [Deltaproteobacteria bacterium OttesenSCG-928-K17]